MEVFKQYDSFKEKCAEFPKRFETEFFTDSTFICHPTAQNELIAVCSDEEARTNALCICRMADMLLMSENNLNWIKFNLAEARKIAENNGFIYISDLYAENAFFAEEWMIDGKHDTIIVNEEYMREKGMKYAPVSPLTNKVLHFKKYVNSFFWKPVAPGEILKIDKKYIENRFEAFYNECLEKLPDLSESETIDFDLFDDKVTIDVNTTRARTIELFFARINKIMTIFASNEEILELCEYEFSAKDFIIDITVEALKKNDILLTRAEFENKYYNVVLNSENTAEKLFVLNDKCGDDAIDCIKLAFIDAVANEYKDEIQYSAEDSSFYNTKLRQMELGNYSPEEEQFLITEILSHKPGDYRVFYYAVKQYPDEAENLAEIAKFWKIASQNEEEMENTVLGAYILDENFDEQGRFCAGFEESRILKEKLEKVIEKYGIDNRECIEELTQHIEMMDKERRTFNGTLFNTTEEKNLAVKNEAYIQEMCVDLSALNENELNSLSEHIENTTLDVNTKSKYQLKVKLALNNVQSSMLEQRCIKLPVMTLDEIIELKEKIVSENYPEAVVKPFDVKIRDAYSSAQTAEIEALLAGSESFSDAQLNDISTKLSSGRYDASISEYYTQKIEEIKDKNIRNNIAGFVEGYEDMNKEELEEVIGKLSDDAYPKYITGPVIAKITDALNNYELNEAAKAFEGVGIATEEQLSEMKKIISEKKFDDEILAPYILEVEQREKVLLDEELNEMCRDIDDMSQEELDELKNKITNSEKEFDEQLVIKYLDKIAQKSCELTNSELAELCKYIFSMEQEELDELKEKLADDKYDKEFTDVYYRKISEREQELLLLELDELCADISEKNIPELEELKGEILDNEAYNDICGKYIISINDRIESIKLAEYKEKIDCVAEMTAEQVEEFRLLSEEKHEEIGEELYRRSIEAVHSRNDALENEALEKLCEGIDEYDFEMAENVRAELESGEYDSEKISKYIEKIDNRILELHTVELESYIEGIDSMSKEEVIKAQIKVQDYDNGCPAELREKYNRIAEAALADIADREVRQLCGDIKSLSAKKSLELIRKLDNMPLEPEAKSKYIDELDSHISELKAEEAQSYIKYLADKMSEFGINVVHLCVPGMSNLFDAKYSSACSNYVSIGRYELPILVHESGTGEGFTMTTEYLYIGDKDEKAKIKINDIASFQAKKSLMSSLLTSVERNGNTNEIPNALNKNVVENVAKVLTALVSFVHDQRSAEHMKELLENAVQEKTMQTQAAAVASVEVAEPAPAVEEPVIEEEKSFKESEKTVQVENVEEVKVNFCDQCGAKITNTNAKFCAECGNKLT